MSSTTIREKPHRLPLEAYLGAVSVAFTACIAERQVVFNNDTVVLAFVDKLNESLTKFDCLAPVYCFMPDHLHVIIQGQKLSSDTWAAMVAFKQRSGFWLRRRQMQQSWQKDFWDHVIRTDEDLGAQVRYSSKTRFEKDSSNRGGIIPTPAPLVMICMRYCGTWRGRSAASTSAG